MLYRLRVWLRAAKCFTLGVSVISITFGAVLSWRQGSGDLTLFLLTVIAGVAMQCGVNLCNSYDDYVRGIDARKDTYGDNDMPIVQGLVRSAQVEKAAYTAFALASGIGLYLVYRCGWPILLCGLVGLLGARTYTGGKFPYKYCGLGPVFVFFLMGPMMVLPAYFIQSGSWQWWPGLASVPLALLISMLMQANDIRDCEDDRKTGTKTIAVRWGRDKAFCVYWAMWVLAYVVQAWCVKCGYLPWTTVLTLLLWPRLKGWYDVYNRPVLARSDIEPLARKSSMLFACYGLLLILALICL